MHIHSKIYIYPKNKGNICIWGTFIFSHLILSQGFLPRIILKVYYFQKIVKLINLGQNFLEISAKSPN